MPIGRSFERGGDPQRTCFVPQPAGDHQRDRHVVNESGRHHHCRVSSEICHRHALAARRRQKNVDRIEQHVQLVEQQCANALGANVVNGGDEARRAQLVGASVGAFVGRAR
jgi:hypothetical protein